MNGGIQPNSSTIFWPTKKFKKIRLYTICPLYVDVRLDEAQVHEEHEDDCGRADPEGRGRRPLPAGRPQAHRQPRQAEGEDEQAYRVA